jgi:hypothetical protein
MSSFRYYFRSESAKQAKIIAPNREVPIYCTVSNITVSGCCLQVGATVQLPEAFHLVADDEDSLNYACRVVWRKEGQLGVEFDE